MTDIRSKLDVALFDEFSEKSLTIREKDDPPITGDNAALVRDVSFKLIMSGIKSKTTSVSTTAVKIPSSNLTDRKSLTIFNEGPVTLLIGDSAVTVSDGYPVPKNTSISLDVNDSVDVYGIVNSGTNTVKTLETA